MNLGKPLIHETSQSNMDKKWIHETNQINDGKPLIKQAYFNIGKSVNHKTNRPCFLLIYNFLKLTKSSWLTSHELIDN